MANIDKNFRVKNGLDVKGTINLASIAESKSETAVDVFVYDTSKDTDGGAWRHRTQHTSWYNETLNTSTRGSRKEFPAVAVIVAETDKVTIYDGDDPSLPMWMVFEVAWDKAIGAVQSSNDVSSVASGQAKMIVGISSTGVFDIDFLTDTSFRYHSDANVAGPWLGYGLAERNVVVDYGSDASGVIVDRNVNDVAMTVLPDAPADPATGLPVPTIAVATDGGMSIIKHDETVWSLGFSTVGYAEASLSIWPTGIAGEFYGVASRVEDPRISTANNDTFYLKTKVAGNAYTEFFKFNVASETWTAIERDWDTASGVSIPSYQPKGIAGLVSLAPSPVFDESMVAYTTPTYNTGWMNGDIKGAFLSDTDDTDLVGSGELVTNGEFTTDISNWTAGPDTTLSHDSGRLKVESTAAANAYAYQAITTVVGQRYRVTTTALEATSTSGNGRTWIGTTAGGSQNTTILGIGDDEQVGDFIATATTTYISLVQATATSGLYMLFDNISVESVDADRSVNNNALIVNGTVTRTAVSTGADLVAYSGFSILNYLEQPYNSDLDFGTGDFCVMGWATASATSDWIVDRKTPTVVTSAGFEVFQFDGDATSGTLRIITRDGSSNTQTDIGTVTSSFTHFVAARRSGVMETYINGVFQTSNADTRDITNTNASLFVGVQSDLTSTYTNGSLALLRISATAPSAAQIKKIYEDEKFLFQENAQATLYGTSDAVTALGHDEDTGLLHVGTSAGRSVFQGLRRVDNTTDAVGTAISAVDGLVVEE